MKTIMHTAPHRSRLASLTTRACALALLALAAPSSLMAGYLFGVTATTDMGNGAGSDISHIVDGSGLIGGPSLSATHASGFPSNTWISGFDVLTGNVTFDLGATKTLQGFTFWNANVAPEPLIDGVQGVEILYSLNGADYFPLPGAPTSFGQAPDISSSPPEYHALAQIDVRYVRFHILSNYGGIHNVGIAEVGFDEFVPVPPPLTADTTVVALKGDPVPGELDTIYKGFGTPSLDGDDIDFLAKIKGPNGSQKAIVMGTPGSVVLRTGDPAPEVGSAIFKAFKDPVFTDGEYAVLAKIAATDGSVDKSNDTGIWSTATGPLRLIAREGAFAPGTSGAIFKAFVSIALPPQPGIVEGARRNGAIVFGERGAIYVAKLASGGIDAVDSTNDLGLWRELVGGPVGLRAKGNSIALPGAELLIREGQQLDVGGGDLRTVKTFACIKAVSGSPGHGRNVASDGKINARVAFTDGTQAIVEFAANSPNYTIIQKTGDLVSPGFPAFKKFGIPAFSQGSGLYTVFATLIDSPYPGFFRFNPGGFAGSQAVAKDDVAPGISPFGLFHKFKDPTASQETIAFTAKLDKEFNADATNDTGLWKGANYGTPPFRLLAREGSEGPTLPGTAIKSFVSQALPDRNGGPLFTAKLAVGTGGVTSADAFALWANIGTTTSESILLARNGHPLDAGGTIYGVRSVTILKAVSGSPGQARAYNKTGGVTYKAKLDGGLEAIFRVLLPPPPGF